MCLAMPGKVIEITLEDNLKMGKIDYSGSVNLACLEYVPEVEIGQYVIVHAGFAINIINEAEAKKTLALWDNIGEHNIKEGRDPFGQPLNPKDDDDSQ